MFCSISVAFSVHSLFFLSAGSLTQDELVHFTKALGHSWTVFAQKIGFEEEELKVVGSNTLSRKGFFAEIWLVPKFDNSQVEQLLCELLITLQRDDVLEKYQSRLSRALDSSDGIHLKGQSRQQPTALTVQEKSTLRMTMHFIPKNKL